MKSFLITFITEKSMKMNSKKSWILLCDYHPLYHRKKKVYYVKHPDHTVTFLGETLEEVERMINVLKIIGDIYDK